MKNAAELILAFGCRNPFVNQVVCFISKLLKEMDFAVYGRNPFVNQVVCFGDHYRRPEWGGVKASSQSLRKSGRLFHRLPFFDYFNKEE